MQALLLPKVSRKQISVYKFNRMKIRPDTKRVRLFLKLQPYETQEALDAYEFGDYYYVYHGNMVDIGFGGHAYRTYYFRYEKTQALFSPYDLRKE